LTYPDYCLEDQLSRLEPPYKSKGEAQIGRLLDRYGLPFIYEQPTVVFSRNKYRIWHPDFTLPSYNNLIVEYAGMPDILDYMKGIEYKEMVFKANAMPALFLYPSDLGGPSWPSRLYERIYETGHQYEESFR